MDHRWSGWPGAWCLDCGNEDPSETCIATHDFEEWPLECLLHPLTECPEPGSKRYDPYASSSNGEREETLNPNQV